MDIPINPTHLISPDDEIIEDSEEVTLGCLLEPYRPTIPTPDVIWTLRSALNMPRLQNRRPGLAFLFRPGQGVA